MTTGPMSAEELAELKGFMSNFTGHQDLVVSKVALLVLRTVLTIETRDEEIARLRGAILDAAGALGHIRADQTVDYGARKRLEPIIEALEWAVGGAE